MRNITPESRRIEGYVKEARKRRKYRGCIPGEMNSEIG